MSFGLFKGVGGTPTDSAWNSARHNNQGFNLSVVDPSFSSSTSLNSKSIWRNPFTSGGQSALFAGQPNLDHRQGFTFGGLPTFGAQAQNNFQPMFGGSSFAGSNGFFGNSFNGNATFGFDPNSVFGFGQNGMPGFSGRSFGGFNQFNQAPQTNFGFGGFGFHNQFPGFQDQFPGFHNQFPGVNGHFQQSGQTSLFPVGNSFLQNGYLGAQKFDPLTQFKNNSPGGFLQTGGVSPPPVVQLKPPPPVQTKPPIQTQPPIAPVIPEHPLTPQSLPPAPEPAPPEGYVPIPVPPSPAPAPEPDTFEGFMPVPVPPAPEPAPPPPAAVSAAQLGTLELMKTVARAGTITLDQKRKLLDAYAAFRPDAQTTKQLATIASAVAAEAFSRPSLVNAAKDWNRPGFDRAGALQELVGVMNATLGMDVKVAFFDTPPVNGKIQHGFYSPSTDTINLNTDQAATGSFSLGAKTVFHEMIHAFHFNRTKHLGLDEVVEKVITGEISFTDGMAYFNLRRGNYFSASEATQRQYELNPHEQLAFLGQKLFEDELVRYNVPDSHQTLASDHPLMQHLRDYGLA